MQIQLNGESKTCDTKTIQQLVEQLHGSETGVAVAVNEQVIRKTDWSSTEISDGQRIDIFSVIAGG